MKRAPGVMGLLAALCAATAAGCGDDAGELHPVVRVGDPATAFAPLVELDERERWLPMGARWFIERSMLWWADDLGCDDREVAVGRTLDERWSPATDWIYLRGIGADIAYGRHESDGACEGGDRRFFADEKTRPFARRDRPAGLSLGEGFYFDLVDSARAGMPLLRGGGRSTVDVPVYYERTAIEVDGRPGLRLTYWMLYGMNEPRGADGAIRRDRVREGDWERVDVLVQDGERPGEYGPATVRLHVDGRTREVSWGDLRRVRANGSPDRTHPVLAASRGSHELLPARTTCPACPRWLTWKALANGPKQLWHGFGGAWGEVGDRSSTTGPLGPHGRWPRYVDRS